ncbi:transposase [Microcoleus sp. N9_B4]|uniref:IS110 family transposase n=1 Tax=Microcoleus sp. N9_B4 TaxID=3055386 RepID=UPI002FCECCF9
MKYLIVGIDVSRSSIAACFLLKKPSNPRDDYFDADIEVYQANIENLNKLRAKIESYKADKIIAICEPTGMNYAQLWMNKLADWGAEVRMISNSKLPNYRAELMGKEGKSGAKTDDIDAFAIACWYFDKELDSYLKIRDPLVSRIKHVCLRLEHLNRVQNPIINRMRQELSWQCPEIALVRSAKLQEELPPLLWGWLAGQRKSQKYDRILETTIGSGIEPQTRWAAKQYCEIEEEIFNLKKQLLELIDHPQFEEYRRIFTKFGFGYQLQGYLLGAIYPIEDFLKDGQAEIKLRKNRQTGKQSKLKLSERRFMRAVGMGVVREDSGQKKKGKQSGSALCRKALWQWCFTRLEVARNNPPLQFTYGQGKDAEQISPAENLRRRKKGGTPIKLARQRVIARCIRELFKELCSIVKI